MNPPQIAAYLGLDESDMQDDPVDYSHPAREFFTDEPEPPEQENPNGR